jgi:hypothetical protein
MTDSKTPDFKPEPDGANPELPEVAETPRGVTAAQWWVICVVIASTVGALLYRGLLLHHLGQTSAMFLGIPAVLAILLALTPKAKSLTGGILKGITLFLLIIAPLLGEGYLCILIASPLFYLVGALVGVIMDANRKGVRDKATLSCIALLILPLCLEGVVPQLTANREQTVEATGLIDAPAYAVEAALTQSPDLNTPLPGLLRIGFPRPLEAHGNGLEIGATRTIHFAGAEGDPPGDLISQVTERGPGFVRVDTVSDTTKLTQWLKWQSSEVEWHAVDAQRTSVTWRVHFERQLDPAWYFVSWERAAVHEAAKYLIQANATPQGNRP